MNILDNYETADKAFRTKAVLSQDNETLLEHLHGLSNQNNTNTGTQHRDIIRGITINNILMQRHIDELNKQNARTQRLVIALTVAALLVGIPQIWFAYRADKKAETEQKTIATQQPAPTQQSAPPSPALPQVSGHAKGKQP
jgi:hypothetical protein